MTNWQLLHDVVGWTLVGMLITLMLVLIIVLGMSFVQMLNDYRYNRAIEKTQKAEMQLLLEPHRADDMKNHPSSYPTDKK